MAEVGFDVANLLYPGATVVDEVVTANVRNMVLVTADGVADVWRWYSRRLDLDEFPSSASQGSADGGSPRCATRRSPRRPNRDEPFVESEHPQAFTVEHTGETVTGILSRDERTATTSIVLFIFL